VAHSLFPFFGQRKLKLGIPRKHETLGKGAWGRGKRGGATRKLKLGIPRKHETLGKGAWGRGKRGGATRKPHNTQNALQQATVRCSPQQRSSGRPSLRRTLWHQGRSRGPYHGRRPRLAPLAPSTPPCPSAPLTSSTPLTPSSPTSLGCSVSALSYEGACFASCSLYSFKETKQPFLTLANLVV
jgi:hypothetical protein